MVKLITFEPPKISAPTNVQVRNVEENSVRLSWDRPEDIYLDHYIVFRKDPDKKDFAQVAKVSKRILYYIDEFLPPGKYEYKLKSVDKYESESDFSEVVAIEVGLKPFYSATLSVPTAGTTMLLSFPAILGRIAYEVTIMNKGPGKLFGAMSADGENYPATFELDVKESNQMFDRRMKSNVKTLKVDASKNNTKFTIDAT